MQSPHRSRSRALLAAATAALVVLPTAAFAQSFTPADDPCLGDPPPAPVADRDEVIEVHLEAVDCGFDNGIFIGDISTEGRQFNPDEPLSRGQMASIIARALEHAGYELPAAPPDAFSDDTTSVHQLNINKLAAVDIVKGVTEDRYEPGTPIKRDQMASLLVRAAEKAYGTAFEPTGANVFTDVSERNVHRDNIVIASEILGLAVGREDKTFQPSALTRRDWAASFIARLVDMTLIDAGEPASDPASGPTVGTTDDERSLED